MKTREEVLIDGKELALAVNAFEKEQMQRAEEFIGTYMSDPVKLAVCKRMLQTMVDVHGEWINRIDAKLKDLES